MAFNDAGSDSPGGCDPEAIRVEALRAELAGLLERRTASDGRHETAIPQLKLYRYSHPTEPTYVLQGREALTPVFDDLNRYEVTTHFNGQSTVTIDGNRATGESYTLAHHVFSEDGERKIMVASLRYLDTFTKIDRSWFFAERKLILDWSETRSLTAPSPASTP